MTQRFRIILPLVNVWTHEVLDEMQSKHKKATTRRPFHMLAIGTEFLYRSKIIQFMQAFHGD